MVKKLELIWPHKGEHVLQNHETGKWEFCGNKELAPRPLIEIEAFGDENRKPFNPQKSNLLVKGENLFALQSLLPYYAEEVKLVYIDPPFNTGRDNILAYDDNFQHSVWLSIMKERLEIAYKLLRDDGVCFVHLNSNEAIRTMVMMDEIFGMKKFEGPASNRSEKGNFLNLITMTTNDPSGFKATASNLFSTANFLIVFAKDRKKFNFKKLFIEKGYDKQYSKILLNPSSSYTEWQWTSLPKYVASQLGYESTHKAKQTLGKNEFEARIAAFAINNADKVFRLAVIRGGAKAKRIDTINLSKQNSDKVYVHPDDDIEDFYILNGDQMLFYNKRIVEIDGQKLPGELLTDVWTDISWNGIANEGGVKLKEGKKPEALIERIIDISIEKEGDIVLDFFAGSGTTGAVAHKKKFRWIMIELNDQAENLALQRMKRVISGEDQTGISKQVNWKGGGGFRFLEVGAPLLVEDQETKLTIINPRYNNGPLIRAVCAVEGFLLTGDKMLHGRNGEHYAHVTEDFVDDTLVRKLKRRLKDSQFLTIYAAKGVRRGLKLPDGIQVIRISNDLVKKYSRSR